ncbi:MAG TPA: nitroreductase family deazaflavin-dependent oxidoreductase [Streptosporangiaceae bacterium]|jgi:deazaflavin-dependent oxidoreductase (nitroreductase family)
MTENAAGASGTSDSGAARNIQPKTGLGRVTSNFFNSVVAGLTKAGISVLGSRVLYVRGRKSGEWRTTPVNLLTHDGARYLVAPRGHTQWVRNMRVAGGGELHVGRRVEEFTATELADADKPEILRAYLRRWKMEVGVFFDGVGPDATDEQLIAITPGYPVFRITVG